jgi:hypothetical protein
MIEADVDGSFLTANPQPLYNLLDTMLSLGQRVNGSKNGDTMIEQQSILPTTLLAPAFERDLPAERKSRNFQERQGPPATNRSSRD